MKLAGNEVVVDAAEATMPEIARRCWLYLMFIAGRKIVCLSGGMLDNVRSVVE